MYKQLVQDIIKAGNKAMDSVPVVYTVDTKDNRYYGYNGLYYNDNHVEFTDDYESDYITALNGDVESIKWANDKRKAEYDTYDDELKASVDKCFDCI